MSIIDALTSVTNIYAEAHRIHNESIMQSMMLEETEYREVILEAMKVLISDQAFDETKTLAAMNSYHDIRTLLKQIKDIRLSVCPDERYTLLCNGFGYFIAYCTPAQTLESLRYMFDNIHVSFEAVHNTFATELGDVFKFEAFTDAGDSPKIRKEFVEYLRRAVFLLLEHLSKRLNLLNDTDQLIVLVYMQMRFHVSLEIDQHISDAKKANSELLQMAQQVYTAAAIQNSDGLQEQSAIPNEDKLVHYTSSQDGKVIIVSTRLLDFDPNLEEDGWYVAVAECAMQIRLGLGNRDNDASEMRRNTIVRNLRADRLGP